MDTPKCPVCGYPMTRDHSDTSSGSNGHTYDRVVYGCTTDDAWITIETPREQA